MGCRDDCSCRCAYGGLIVLPIIFSFIGWLLLWFSVLGCNVFRITISARSVYMDDYRTFEDNVGVGYWMIESDYYGDDCKSFDEGNPMVGFTVDDIDAPLRFARFASLTAVLTTFVAFVFTTVPACCAIVPQWYFLSLTAVFAVLAMLPILSLVGMSSDICQNADDCRMAYGGVITIIASGFLLVAAATAVIQKPLARYNRRGTGGDGNQQGVEIRNVGGTASVSAAAEGTGTAAAAGAAAGALVSGSTERKVETTEHADGSTMTVTTETVTHADGSQTITQTKEVQSAGMTTTSTISGATTVAASATSDVEEAIPVAPSPTKV